MMRLDSPGMSHSIRVSLARLDVARSCGVGVFLCSGSPLSQGNEDGGEND